VFDLLCELSKLSDYDTKRNKGQKNVYIPYGSFFSEMGNGQWFRSSLPPQFAEEAGDERLF